MRWWPARCSVPQAVRPAIQVAARAFGDVFGRPTVFIRSGGSIPIVGDLFDVFNRANLRNARLLQQHLASPPSGRERFRIRTLALPIALLAGAIAVALGVAYLVVSLWMH